MKDIRAETAIKNGGKKQEVTEPSVQNKTGNDYKMTPDPDSLCPLSVIWTFFPDVSTERLFSQCCADRKWIHEPRISFKVGAVSVSR